MARILLVEDDPDQIGIRRMLLESAGHEVRTAACVEEARLKAADSEVIVMDLMPGCEDFVAGLPESARVIVLSGKEASAAVAARSAYLLKKPCPTRTLMQTIARICSVLLIFIAVAAAQTFTISKTVEVLADLDMRAPGTNWAEAGHEAALATVLLDGKPQQNVMLYAGAERFTYPVFLGRLTAGQHRLAVEGKGVELVGARFREDDSDYIRNAPVVYARANTVGRHTDIPLILYCERLSEKGQPILRYTLIFSNEDGGTSTRALMARWGRTTDVEYVYKGVLESDGTIKHAMIQTNNHKDAEFAGKREGSHPLLMPITDNNMIGEADTSIPIRYQIEPILVDLSAHSREEVMDAHPIAYKVMAQELVREDKLRPWGVVDGEKISEPRNYLYVELKLGKLESAVSTLVRLKGGAKYYSSSIGRTDYAISIAKRNPAESTFGFARTTVELPPGTRADQIAEIGFECVTPEKTPTGPCRVEAVTKTFLLDSGYRPGSNVWTMAQPVEIPAGQIWTSQLK
jgi:CheY-like chemotaxis protein